MNTFRGFWGLALAGVIVSACVNSTASSAEIRLARHPDYHEGKIVFSYLGDLWVVQEDGANAQRLTVHSARDIQPRFSPDGKWIAFSSDRYGNYDVFIMPAQGGPPKRLTFNTAPDTVVGWTRDSQRVIFSSARGRVFPGIPSLYEIPADGSLEQPIAADWGFWGSYSPDGKQFVFNRHPAVWSRKHYRGSYSADLWLMDVGTRTFKKLLDADLPDDKKPNNFWPMFGKDEVYFVSDREVEAKAGSRDAIKSKNNIWKIRAEGGAPQQITHHTSGSLFWPSLSRDGRTIVYEENFGLWKLDLESGKSTEIKIDITSDDKYNNLEFVTIQSEADAYHLSPTAKRAVISTHGELFTIATDRGDVQRLTQSPSVREVQPQWSPDGKWIAFVSDKSGREEVWLCNERGKQARSVSNSDCLKGQLQWSPDSSALIYTGSDKNLYKYTLADNDTKVLATGQVVGFGGAALANPQWSLDGRWISFSKSTATLLPHVYVIRSDGGKEQRVTDVDSYTDSNALWTKDGKYIVYLSGQDVGNIGQAGRSSAQIMSVALQPVAKDPRDTGIDSEEQATQAESEQRKRPPGDIAKRPAAIAEVKIDFNRIGRRTSQLTRTGDTISAMALAPDGKTIAFVTSGTEGGRSVQSIWTMTIEGERPTRIVQSGRSTENEETPQRLGGFGGPSALQYAPDGRTLYYRQGGNIYAAALGGQTGGSASGPPPGRGAAGGRTPAATEATGARRIEFAARVEVDHRAERKQVFEESWRIMKHRFYDADMHGVDWNKMKSVYEPLLSHAADQEEMHNIVSQMIGELNASHTGISGGGRRGRTDPAPVQTRHPGFEMEPDLNGYYRVGHIYKNGPADKDYVKLKVGDFVLAIDGQSIKSGDNYWKFYTLAPSAKLEFTVNAKAAEAGAWTTKITPVSSAHYANLQYEKWVADRRALVDKLSNGAIGYLHIRQMNEASLRKFERDLAELHTKKALVIDQRFNPGGSIDQELLQILQQKQYQYTRVRDSVQVTRPLRGYFGPMVVMANERSTSDAEVFPDGFRTLKLGKVIGVTTYGAVIGTGAYTMMDGSSIRTPGSGLWNVNGTNLENYGVPPDIYVDNTPEDFLKGRDAQLEKAVEVLFTEIK